MKAMDTWAKEVERRAGLITGLASTSSTKYDVFKRWFADEIGVEPAVCYLSEPMRQWTARVGQALMGLPSCLVILVAGKPDDAMNHRLERLQRYMTGLRTTIVLSGEEGQWSIAFVVGVPGDDAFDRLRGDYTPPSARTLSSTIDDNTARRRPRSTTSTPRFFDLEPDAQASMIWEHLLGRGSLPIVDAIRHAAHGLRADGMVDFVRLRPDGLLYTEIELALAYASRRGILFDRPRRGEFRALKSDPEEFTPADWRRCLVETVSMADWTDRDIVVRSAAAFAVEYYGLEMIRLRTGGRVDSAIRAAIGHLISEGEFAVDDGGRLRRIQAPRASAAESTPASDARTSLPAETRPSAHDLRNLMGHIPPEAESVLLRHLGAPFESVESLRERVQTHLASFEAAFAEEEFLDVGGARRLAGEAEQLLGNWPTSTVVQRALAQAAILYFLDGAEADDDFAINGLRTDKAVMAAVQEALR